MAEYPTLDPFVDPAAEDEGDLGVEWLQDINQISVSSLEWTVSTAIDQMRRDKIDISPSFQRREVWSRNKKALFLESVALQLPVPPVVLAEKTNERGSFFVLDGRQRLLTLRQYCVSDNDERDVGFDLFVPTALKLMTDLNGVRYQDLEDQEIIDNSPLRAMIIRGWKSTDFVHTVFHRLNSGGVPLNPQELRYAMYPGEFRDHVANVTAERNPIMTALGRQTPDPRMSDIELVVRHIGMALLPTSYRGNLKQFLDNAQKELNRLWGDYQGTILDALENLFETVEFVNRAFGSDAAFSLYETDPEKMGFTNRFNRAIFDALTIGLRDRTIRHALRDDPAQVKNAFIGLCANQRFVDAVTRTTKTTRALETRVELWAAEIRNLTGLDVGVHSFGEASDSSDEEE